MNENLTKLKLQLPCHLLKALDQPVCAIRRIYQIYGAWVRFSWLPPQKEQLNYVVGLTLYLHITSDNAKSETNIFNQLRGSTKMLPRIVAQVAAAALRYYLDCHLELMSADSVCLSPPPALAC